MEVLETVGGARWTESKFYREKLHPMLHDFATEEKRTHAAQRLATRSASTVRKHRKQPTSGLWGVKILLLWAFMIITVLFGVHQRFVFQMSFGDAGDVHCFF
jgi:hypothetical protein